MSGIELFQHPFDTENSICFWHREHKESGKLYKNEEILPGNCCPWLFHSLYPYMLAFYYGAKFQYNADGDSNVCCPAVKGLDLLVKIRDNDGSFDPRIMPERKQIIFAEVVGVNGDCPYHHAVGDIIIFPTCMKEFYLCPAGFNNVFPLLRLEPPSCIDLEKIRCPDSAEQIFYSSTRPGEGA